MEQTSLIIENLTSRNNLFLCFSSGSVLRVLHCKYPKLSLMKFSLYHDMLMCLMFIKMCFLGFFIPGLPKLFACCDMHSRGRQRYLPKLDKHFKKHNVEPSHYCTPWFFKLFLECVSCYIKMKQWLVIYVYRRFDAIYIQVWCSRLYYIHLTLISVW